MPDDPRLTELLARFQAIGHDRRTTETTWQEIADHELGRRDFITLRTPGEQRQQRIYDDTAKVSGGLLAGAMHSLLTNPATRWFKLRFEDEALNQAPDAAGWLFEAENQLYNAMNRPDANFHAQLAELYIDLVFFGTGGLFIEDAPGSGVRFSSRPLAELFVSENQAGRIDTVVRSFLLSARQAAELFGDAARAAMKDLDGRKLEDKRPYIHMIFPNEERIFGRVDAKGMPWASVFVSLDDRKILSEGGYHELPMAIARWQKDAGESYGRGPGWDSLSDAKMLNEMKKVSLKMGQKAIDPPLLVDSEGVLPGHLRVDPGGVIPVNAVMATMNPPIQPLPSGGNFEISVQLISDTRRQVQEAFHHQLIELIRDPRMTATQVLELSAQMQRHLAPILGRMHTELLEPIIERIFGIEARANRLPPVPQGLQGIPLRIDYVSPVARAQRASDAKAIIDLFTVGTNLSQVSPDVFDLLDTDAAMRELAESLGVPPTVIRSARDVEARREAARELAEEQAQAQSALQTAEAAAKLAPVTREAFGAVGGPGAGA